MCRVPQIREETKKGKLIKVPARGNGVVIALISHPGPPFQQHYFRAIPEEIVSGTQTDGDQFHQSQQKHP